MAVLDVFGSAASEEFDDQSSDVDLLVEFDGSVKDNRFDNLFALHDESLRGFYNVRLILLSRGGLWNPYFIDAVEKDSMPLRNRNKNSTAFEAGKGAAERRIVAELKSGLITYGVLVLGVFRRRYPYLLYRCLVQVLILFYRPGEAEVAIQLSGSLP